MEGLANAARKLGVAKSVVSTRVKAIAAAAGNAVGRGTVE